MQQTRHYERTLRPLRGELIGDTAAAPGIPPALVADAGRAPPGPPMDIWRPMDGRPRNAGARAERWRWSAPGRILWSGIGVVKRSLGSVTYAVAGTMRWRQSRSSPWRPGGREEMAHFLTGCPL